MRSPKTYLTWISTTIISAMAILFPLAFLPFSDAPLFAHKQVIFTVVLALLVTGVLYEVVFLRACRYRQTIVDIPILLLIIFGLISSITSVSRQTSIYGSPYEFVLTFPFILLCALWFWFIVYYLRQRQPWNVVLTAIMGSGMLASAMFLLSGFPAIEALLPTDGLHAVSSAHSSFGIFLAITSTLSLGLLLIKQRAWQWQIVPALSALLGLIVLIKLGFAMPLLIFVIGLGGLFVIGSIFMPEVRISIYSVVIALFVGAISLAVIGIPQSWKANLPVEVAIGSETSTDIVQATITDSVGRFFIGSGPATFVQMFSLYRPAEFNSNQIVQNIRFQQPYSSVQAITAEMGILGLLSFFAIVLLMLGAGLSSWLAVKKALWQRMKERLQGGGEDFTAYAEVSVVLIAWMVATVGLFVTYYDAILWWLWWTLLAVSLVAMAAVSPKLIKDKGISIVLSPQYSLLLSFGLLVLFTSVVVGTVYASRQHMGLSQFHRASQTPNMSQAISRLQEAKTYQTSYAPYDIAIARSYLELARQASAQGVTEENTLQIVNLLTEGVSVAIEATEEDPNNIASWETLGILYLNSRPFAANANDKAKAVYERAATLEPANPEWFWRLGNIAAINNDFDDAIVQYEKAISLRRDYIVAYKELADVYELSEETEKAIETYRTALTVSRNETPELLYHLGRLYFNRDETGDSELARGAWTQATQILPNYSNALYSLGLLAERERRYNDARVYFTQVQELNPDDSNVAQKLQSLR